MNCGNANSMTNIAGVYWIINIFCLVCIVHVSFVSVSFNQYPNTILVSQYVKGIRCQFILLE